MLKTRVYRRPMPILQNTIDFLKKAEEEHGAKVYDIDPFMEVYRMRDNVYSLFSESVSGFVDQWVHIVVGTERALVIDTAWGIGDLKGLIRELIGDMPYDVVNTHFHLDHAYGNYQFDEVYCHYYTVPDLVRQMTPGIWDRLLDENGKGQNMDFTRDDLIPYHEYRIVGVPNHYVFDLGGGHEVELIWVPGHASGGVVLLAKKERILFTGDAINTMVMLGGPKRGDRLPLYAKYNCVEAMRDVLKELAERESEWDVAFPGHDALELPGRIVRDMYEACDAVVKDPLCHDEVATYQYITKQHGDGQTKTVGVCAVGYFVDRGIYYPDWE